MPNKGSTKVKSFVPYITKTHIHIHTKLTIMLLPCSPFASRIIVLKRPRLFKFSSIICAKLSLWDERTKHFQTQKGAYKFVPLSSLLNKDGVLVPQHPMWLTPVVFSFFISPTHRQSPTSPTLLSLSNPKSTIRWAMVVHTCDLSYLGG